MSSRLWWATTLTLLGAAVAFLLGAAMWLNDAGLGAAAFGDQPGCASALVGGLTLLGAAGASLTAAATSVDRRSPGSIVAWDWARIAFATPIPLAGLALTGPGMLGCGSAGQIEQLGSLGEALLGTSGAALGAACAFALGASLMSGLRVDRPPSAVLVERDDDELDLEAEPAAKRSRFRLGRRAARPAAVDDEDDNRFRGIDA